MKVKAYKGLSDRIMIGGIPKKLFILLSTVSAVLFLSLESIYVLIISFVLYLLLVLLYRIDPFFLEIFYKHINQPDHYDS
jgi:type IV secretory pathway TrbD component